MEGENDIQENKTPAGVMARLSGTCGTEKAEIKLGLQSTQTDTFALTTSPVF